MSRQTIRDAPIAKQSGHTGGRSHYLLPVKVCATCGQSTKNSFHHACKRVKGKLVVREQ